MSRRPAVALGIGLLVVVGAPGHRDPVAADAVTTPRRPELPRIAEPPVAQQLGDDIIADSWAGPYLWVAVSANGGVVAIGEPPAGVNETGLTRVYDWDGDSWIQLGGDIAGEAEWDFSGTVALSADGRRVAIGASQNDGNGNDAGHVRVYDWDGAAWTQAGADIDGEAAGDYSGASISLSADGRRIAVGALSNGGNGDDAGHVRVYDWDGAAWTQAGADIDGEADHDRAGIVSISADGDRIAVGAPENDAGLGPPESAGHVRVYEWDGALWVQVGDDIDGDDPEGTFGRSVSLSADGDRVAIGAPRQSGPTGELSGQVRVVEWTGTDWVQMGSPIAGEAAGDRAGISASLAADGGRVAIGAPDHAANGRPDSGQILVATWNGTAWTSAGNDIDGAVADDQLGWSVSLSADGTRVGGTAGPFPDNSRVRMFALDQPAPPTTTPAPPATTPATTPALPDELPGTGSNVMLSVLAAAIVTAGFYLVLAARRRRC